MLDRLSQQRRGAIVIALVLLATVTTIVLTRPPTWIETGSAGCSVHNPYTGTRGRPARMTAATWNGPCVAGRAEGWGTLDWIRDGWLTIHYEGEMAGGRMTGRGAMTAADVRYDGTWSDGSLEHGVATYPDGRRFEGDWYQRGWSRGVLIAPGNRRFEGTWYLGRLDGKGVIQTPDGRYEGDLADGKPYGLGVFEAANGTRFNGEWRKGIPTGQRPAGLPSDAVLGCLWESGAPQYGDFRPYGVPAAKDCRLE